VYYEILGTVDNLSYSLAAGDLSLYRLPNEYDWPAFPEIAQVQAIVEQELLVDDLAGCFIRREGLHSATARRPVYNSTAWQMDVDLECPPVWKTATLYLYPDGHHEDLHVSWSSQ